MSDSLHYLMLAGVKWELNPNSTMCNAQCADDKIKNPESKSESSGDVNLKSQILNLKSVTVPPIAPVAPNSGADVAAAANSFLELQDAIKNFNHPLKQFAKNTVVPCFSETNSDLLIITDIPGSDDDETGNILMGAAGELMDKMLQAIGKSRSDVSVVPLIFWRTPGGRAPTREEMDLARPFVTRAVELLQPKMILTLGTLTAFEVANAKLPADHGKSREYRVESKDLSAPDSVLSTLHSIPVIPIYHPNYLMLKPAAKRDVWEALQNLQNILKNSIE